MCGYTAWSASPYPSLKEWVTSHAARLGKSRNNAFSLSGRPPKNCRVRSTARSRAVSSSGMSPMKGGAPASWRRLLIKKSAVLQPTAHLSLFPARRPRARFTVDPLVDKE